MIQSTTTRMTDGHASSNGHTHAGVNRIGNDTVNNSHSTKPTGTYAPRAEGLLAPLSPFLNDNRVSEIMLNRPGEVFVERDGKLTVHSIPAFNEATLAMLFQLIANENQQILSPEKPILSGSLHDGSRIQLVLPPVARHYTFAIRRQVVRHLSLADYAKQDFYGQATPHSLNSILIDQLPTSEKALIELYQAQAWDKFISLAIHLKKNIVISGGTSSGKTTFLNACLRELPMDTRIITLEDTREIELSHLNQVNLLSNINRSAYHRGTQHTENSSPIDMQMLVQCCLRLRPDRIIMGEIRGKEILDFVSSCSTGHEGSLTSIHANNPHIAFMRMTQLYKQNNVPSMTDADILRELHAVIDIIVQVGKTSSGRQVQSIYYKYGDSQPDGIQSRKPPSRQCPL